jgi:lipid-binding SYLF domain-containing protein
MNKNLTVAVAMMAAAILVAAEARVGQARTPEMDKVRAASEVLEEMVGIPEEAIPAALLRSAHGILVIPGMLKAGYLLGARYGTGVLSIRNPDNSWSNPIFVTLAGGSFGLQIGVQASDVILVFKTKRSLDGVTRGKFTLGADVSVAAGPVGRHAEAATDTQLKAEIYSYSKSRGLFAGIALEGAMFRVDDGDNAAFYNKAGLTAGDILAGDTPDVPAEARAFRRSLATHAR